MQGGLAKIINSKSKTFLAFCFCFIAGVAVFSLKAETLPASCFYWPALAGIFILIIFWDYPARRLFAACFLLFLFGGWRAALAVPEQTAGSVGFYNGSRKEFFAVVASEPDVRMSEVRYVVAPRGLKGKILLTAPLYPRYDYGDELRISCLLKKPTSAAGSDFDYEKYLLRYGVQSICGGAKTEVVASGHASIAMSFILRVKAGIGAMVERLWPEPQASFMAGLLYGSKSGLPADLSDNFNRTGITHIIAVSGFNITIIVTALMLILIRIGFYRQRAFWAVIFSALVFVFFTGASASVVRAAIMGITVLTGQHIGRPAQVGNLLVLAAAVMVGINPHILWWDAGFQLSFLSTLGLVYLSPAVEKFFFGNNIKGVGVIAESFVATISAIIATTPLILYQFGRLSVVAPLVNMLILWLVPWLMLFGFLSLLCGFIFFPLGQVTAWIAGAGLNYVIMVVNWFGGKRWAAVETRLPLGVMVIMYAAIAALAIRNRMAVKKLCRQK